MEIFQKRNLEKEIINVSTSHGENPICILSKPVIEKRKKKKQNRRKRCSHINCKKKLKLTDMNCRCNKRFCPIHRLPETHNCCWNPKSIEEMKIYEKKSGLTQKAAFKKIEQI
tara:strand:- start:849 stop:1187 length:339 start_codon:yes stop_codon:yes gene_type:complete